MTVSKRLKEFLDSSGIVYHVMTHKVAYTAQDVAAKQGVTGWQVAKSVVLKCDDDFMLVVLQAPAMVDFERLREALGCKEARLASESEMERLFPGVELGAESPFGNLYELPVYIDRGLSEMSEIVFNAGTHTETIRMKYEDYERLVSPEIIEMVRRVKV
jgi:Ala-tRNA(Pro) deacylase